VTAEGEEKKKEERRTFSNSHQFFNTTATLQGYDKGSKKKVWISLFGINIQYILTCFFLR